MRIEKQNLINQLPLAAAFLYAAVMTVVAALTGSTIFPQINIYITDAVALWAAFLLMFHAIQEHNGKELLYAALGMSCLTLGNLYFVLLDVVSFKYDVISVGLFAKVCCYLFFIAVLSAQKPFQLKLAMTVDIGSFAVAATCAYAVIANSYLVINLSVILLNLLCAVLAAGLLRYPRQSRFFAQVMLFLAVKDILSVFTVLAFATDALSPALYILIVRSVLLMGEEGQNA